MTEIFNEPMEIIMSDEDIARVRRLIGHQGFYDASQDDYLNPPEPEIIWRS